MTDEVAQLNPLPPKHVAALCALACVMTFLVIWLSKYNEHLGVLVPVPDAKKGWVVAALTLAGSVLSAAYVTLGLYAYGVLLRKTRRNKFREFFGLDIEGHATIVVVPRFPVGAVPAGEGGRGINNISLKNLRELDSNCISLDDLIAVRHVNTLFAEHGAAPPKIFFDEDVWKVLYGQTPATDPKLRDIHAARNMIVIGLFSSAITTSVNERVEHADFRAFRLSSPEDARERNLRQLDIAPAGCALDDWRRKARTWRSECEGSQFALLSKVKAPGDRQLMILGGSDARATRKLASHLKKCWPMVHGYVNPGFRTAIGRKPFAMHFIVPNDLQYSPRDSFAYYSDT